MCVSAYAVSVFGVGTLIGVHARRLAQGEAPRLPFFRIRKPISEILGGHADQRRQSSGSPRNRVRKPRPAPTAHSPRHWRRISPASSRWPSNRWRRLPIRRPGQAAGAAHSLGADRLANRYSRLVSGSCSAAPTAPLRRDLRAPLAAKASPAEAIAVSDLDEFAALRRGRDSSSSRSPGPATDRAARNALRPPAVMATSVGAGVRFGALARQKSALEHPAHHLGQRRTVDAGHPTNAVWLTPSLFSESARAG